MSLSGMHYYLLSVAHIYTLLPYLMFIRELEGKVLAILLVSHAVDDQVSGV